MALKASSPADGTGAVKWARSSASHGGAGWPSFADWILRRLGPPPQPPRRYFSKSQCFSLRSR